MYHYWFSLSAIFSLAKNCICRTWALSDFFAKALIRRQKLSIPLCSVIEPTDGEKKNILLCDCQKSKATTGIFLTKPRQRDADQKPGPESLFFAGFTADWTFSHWKEQSRAGNAKTDERRWRELLYFFPYLCGLPLLWRDFILHPALCWCCWMSIMESVERGRGGRWRRETRTLTPMQMDK